MRIIFSILFFLCASFGAAADMDSLRADGSVKVTIELPEEKAEYISKEPIPIRIKVESLLPFEAGTRFKLPQFPEGFIRQDSSFAVNDSRREGEQLWRVQLWSMTAFIESKGAITLPPMGVSISLKGDTGEIKGTILTAPTYLKVIKPRGISGEVDYVVSETFSVEERWSSNEESFEIGDALSRSITMNISGAPGMMLPQLQLTDLEGVDIYHKPAQVNDKSSRGDLTGTRIEEAIYTFEQPGTYNFEEVSYQWWDLKSNELQSIVLPARTVVVTGAVKGNAWQDAVTNVFNFVKDFPIWNTLILIFLGWALYKITIAINIKERVRSHLSDRKSEKVFLQDLMKGNGSGALDYLYEMIGKRDEEVLRKAFSGQKDCLVIIDDIFSLSYDREQNIKISQDKGKLLIKRLKQVRLEKRRWWEEPVTLKLN